MDRTPHEDDLVRIVRRVGRCRSQIVERTPPEHVERFDRRINGRGSDFDGDGLVRGEDEVPVCRMLDLSLPGSVATLYAQTSSSGRHVDVLVNNAGFGDYGDFTETDVQKNHDMLQVNIVTLTALTRLYTPAMLERRHGGVINLASIVAFQPGPLMAVYYASKAHVLSFTEALASELAGSGIAVTALCPGPTETGFADVTGLEKSVLFERFRPVPAKDVAEFGYRAWEKGKVVAIYGLPNKSLVFGERFLPRGVTSNLMKWMQKKAV